MGACLECFKGSSSKETTSDVELSKKQSEAVRCKIGKKGKDIKVEENKTRKSTTILGNGTMVRKFPFYYHENKLANIILLYNLIARILYT